ncbi:MAG: NADH:ubiquinone reductase (Na(+)-transporting) subunit E [Omnitrophica WOR_2 bacterium GWF2_43_52]|nr:MAG: NADH:ubiquinone reductase (Na(+)-transporting) subunit E [Omnitrophica WOR_2 bacterium GWC2_44_8]OGX21704.1 MAG: NADH:ubiquinone reductase (Na(+)-transporting) subunit E [Omnitrophica WOR_2 bacterium GWF2_43_52]OGX52897.1 MAG: NADH:ubiquinone reductase (Na(+)-transporting) subunit E [Omnitrophica WOR_2 bacterium RIFOXYC2_FULL_43_9]HAH19969.1 NADH:ubiquinone reductase (Na(+)-transporting) subunit E [Candidatus Omnitrophota bacterium]HBG63134.1 NADH:ubiquinone reductase (Na(+)-transportin
MNPMNPLIILVASIFTHNIALAYILGMCPFIVISKNYKTAVGMGISIIFVVTLTAIINWPIYWLVLVPAHSEILAFLIFIIVIAATVQLLEMIIEKFFPPLQSSFGIFLPLITVNCIVLAVCLFMVLRKYDFIQTLCYAFGTSCGWALAIILMAAIKEKMMLASDIPKGLRGAGITMIIAGLMALAFIGFAGIITLQ